VEKDDFLREGLNRIGVDPDTYAYPFELWCRLRAALGPRVGQIAIFTRPLRVLGTTKTDSSHHSPREACMRNHSGLRMLMIRSFCHSPSRKAVSRSLPSTTKPHRP
jgi:hypothetical protein